MKAFLPFLSTIAPGTGHRMSRASECFCAGCVYDIRTKSLPLIGKVSFLAAVNG